MPPGADCGEDPHGFPASDSQTVLGVFLLFRRHMFPPEALNRWSTLAVLLALLIVFAGCGTPGEYPNRPITLICPWSAGGGSDRLARQFASQLERELDVPVNVVNATGGGGVTGHARGSQARADGYTMTLVTAELAMLHWRGLTEITYEDFHPLALVNRDNAALFVRSDAPWNSLEELQNEIQEQPGLLRASGTAFGGIWHLSLGGWLIESGLSPDAVRWVSLAGAGPALQELMSGGVEIVVCSVPEAQSLLDAGNIRSLGVMAPERLAGASDVPTFKEQGSNWTSGTWRGLALPTGVPQTRVEILSNAVQSVLKSQEYRSFLQSAGFGAPDLPSKKFGPFLQQQDEQFGEILTSEAFESVQTQQYGPWLFPSILLGMLAVVLVSLVWSGALRVPSEAQALSGGAVLRGSLSIAAIGFYVLVAETVGFVLTATVLLGGLFWWYGVRWWVAVSLILVLIPATYQLFAIYLRVPLPWGWLGW